LIRESESLESLVSNNESRNPQLEKKPAQLAAEAAASRGVKRRERFVQK
jgi:hypothetical protein